MTMASLYNTNIQWMGTKEICDKYMYSYPVDHYKYILKYAL